MRFFSWTVTFPQPHVFSWLWAFLPSCTRCWRLLCTFSTRTSTWGTTEGPWWSVSKNLPQKHTWSALKLNLALVCDLLPLFFVVCRIFWSHSFSPSCGWSAVAAGPKLFLTSNQPQTQQKYSCSSQPAELQRTDVQRPRSLAGHVWIHLWWVFNPRATHTHTPKPTHSCPFSRLPAGLWICKRRALGREHLVCLQRDGLVQDGSEIPHQERLRETLQRDAATAIQREQLRPAWGESGPAADQTKQFQSGQGGWRPEGPSTGQLQPAADELDLTADVPRQARKL